LVESEPHLDVDLPPEQLQEDLVESEAHLDIDLPLSYLVKSKIQGRKVVLGGPISCGKKTKSINQLYDVEPSSSKKVSKSSGKRRRKK
jgi:uncharacterized linocin/CFP29 family protein